LTPFKKRGGKEKTDLMISVNRASGDEHRALIMSQLCDARQGKPNRNQIKQASEKVRRPQNILPMFKATAMAKGAFVAARAGHLHRPIAPV
jgi:hypothetical protein